MSARHFRTCTLCEAMCGIVVEHEGDRVLSIRGDADDPFSAGHICPKAAALQDIHADPDRLRVPHRRDGDRWIPMSWDDAFDLVTARLLDVRRRHGPDATAAYLGNPTVHSLGAMLFVPQFVRALRTRNRYSATSVDQLPHHIAATLMFGHGLLLPVPDLDHTDHLLMLGANPAVSNGSLMSAGDVKGRLKALKGRAGRLIVVDPRRTETAQLADAHHFIRPGTDALLLLALLHVIFNEALSRVDSLPSYYTGVDEIRALAARFPPERVSPVTGVRAGTIRQMARDFARAERAVCYGRVGVSMQEHGALACWLINVLNAVTGRLDVRGGAMFARPAVEVVRGLGASRIGRWRSRVRQLPEYGGELPVSALAEEIETPGAGQVRALVTHAGNPVLSSPNGQRLAAAIATLDFFVAIDFYINETTRQADVILPPTGPLERDHYDVLFHALAVRNTAKYSPPMVPRGADARHDWEILNELTLRLTEGDSLARAKARLRAAANRMLGARGLLDLALRFGPFGNGYNPVGRGLSVRALQRAPHGLDLGERQPVFPGRLRTADRTVRLAPTEMLSGIPALEAQLERDLGAARASGGNGASLVLIGRRDLRSNNSWMHNAERLMRGADRCTLLMHPRDAESRSLVDGARVRVRSRVGEVIVPLQLTDAIMAGVVSLPHGFGHSVPGVRLGVASAHAGASINDLTDDQRLDPLAGTAAFSGVPVEVRMA